MKFKLNRRDFIHIELHGEGISEGECWTMSQICDLFKVLVWEFRSYIEINDHLTTWPVSEVISSKHSSPLAWPQRHLMTYRGTLTYCVCEERNLKTNKQIKKKTTRKQNTFQFYSSMFSSNDNLVTTRRACYQWLKNFNMAWKSPK